MITGVFGVTFLYQAMRPTASEAESADTVKIRHQILQFWLMLYGFVGSQLGWTLRPFFGSPGSFELFRPKDGNFISGVWQALVNVLSTR